MSKNKKDSVIVMIAMLILIFLFNEHFIFLWIALIISLISLISTKFTAIIHLVLLKITHIIGQIVQKAILISVFFIILTPIALLSRLLGKKDIMMLKKGYKSTFLDSSEKIDKTYFNKLW